MKAVIQTVKDASCTVEGKVTGAIDEGLLIYFGVEKGDTEDLIRPLFEKILKMRIYRDENGKSNLSIRDKSCSILIISQFTLAADIYRGTRPSFDTAEKPSVAEVLYEKAIATLKEMGMHVEVGKFGAHMEVRYMNDGPETFIIDSARLSKKVTKN